jgi:hypothetical protein
MVALLACCGGCSDVEQEEAAVVESEDSKGLLSRQTSQSRPEMRSKQTAAKASLESLTAAETAAVERAQGALREHLADNANAVSARLESIDAVEWADSGLGCSEPGETNLPSIEPGYNVVLVLAGLQYEIHLGTMRARVCDAPRGVLQRRAQSFNLRRLEIIQQQALTDLASRLGLSPDAVELGLAKPAAWPTAALGCPEAGQVYAPQQVRGFRIPLTVDGRTWYYHTDGKRYFPCPRILDE